jgi:predicted transport protein
LASGAVALWRHLQTTIERNMETFFGVRFLASEYSTALDTADASTPWELMRTAHRRSSSTSARGMRTSSIKEVHPRDHTLLAFVKLDPRSIDLEEGFTRDVRSIGHFGTGDLEIRIRSRSDLDRASDLLLRSYQAS